jgi:hypothetical protein
MFFSIGPDHTSKCLRSQTLSAFNTTGNVMEWRLKAGRPMATIIRYFTNSDGRKSQFLVISKVSRSQACHMAYIDVSVAGTQANLLARQAADLYAENFNCRRHKPFLYQNGQQHFDGLPGGGGCPRQ